MTKILTFGNPKTQKSVEYGYQTAIMHLTPHKLDKFTMCPNASDGCIASCLNVSGAAYRQNAKDKARANRTNLFINDRRLFWVNFLHEAKLFKGRAVKAGLIPVLRVRGTHDRRPPKHVLAKLHNMGIKTYDYTKNWGEAPAENYHLTYSRTENHDDKEVIIKLRRGHNVAIVFRDKIPRRWLGYEVIDGTVHDLRFLDPKPVIVGLKALARAKKDKTGFVVDVPGGYAVHTPKCTKRKVG